MLLSLLTTPIRAPREVRWIPPVESFIKINVDGSSFGNPGRSGFGGLLRNELDEWLGGFYGNYGITTDLTAELHAIATGLRMAWSTGYRSLICETDSKMGLILIMEGVDKFHPQATIV